jgi:hypothetical protein
MSFLDTRPEHEGSGARVARDTARLDGYFHLDAGAPDPLADLEQRLATAQIERVLVVETWAGKEKGFLDQLAARPPGPADTRPVAYCFRGGTEAAVAPVIQLPAVRALRFKTADLESAPAWVAEQLENSRRFLLCHGELGAGRLARAVAAIAARHPALRIYIPHLGWPRRDKADDPDWPAAIAALGALPNVVLGVSGLASFSRIPFPHDDMQPLAQRAIEVFGPGRLIAATDHPYIEKRRYSEYYHLSRKWISARWPDWSDCHALRP